jgi:hypothetical protein
MASDDLGDDEVLMLLGATACVLLACIRPKSVKNDRGSKTRRVWVRDLFRRRCIAGAQTTLLPELVNYNDSYSFRNYLRMDEETFDLLFSMIEDSITGSYRPRFRRPISARDKLIVTLRYLATGKQPSLMNKMCIV